MRKFVLFLAICVIAACNSTSPPTIHTFGAAGGTTSPIIPASWTTPAWFIDPANSSGTASDSNNCTAAGTPCLTWHEINDHRWGCIGSPKGCPRLRQNTAIEFLSSGSNDSDPVYFYPTIENAAVVKVFGPLGASQQVASGTLSNVTAKNRSTPQLLLAQSGATAVGQLVVNTNGAHPSRAWTYALSSGSIYKMTQPVTAASVPGACGTEVDTWANTDTVVVYAPVLENLVDVSAVFEEYNGGFTNNFVYIYNIGILDPASFDTLHISNASLYESVSQRAIRLDGNPGFTYSLCNNEIAQNFSGGSISGQTVLDAGAIGLNAQNNVVLNVKFQDDIILASSSVFQPGTGFDSGVNVYVETSKILAVDGLLAGTGGIWWGPGTINVRGTGRFVYSSPASTNLLVGVLQLNGGTTGHSLFTSSNVDTPCGGITVNKSNLDAAASATCATTGFGGLAFNPGGGSFTTGGL